MANPAIPTPPDDCAIDAKWVAGVDGCRGGWLYVARRRTNGEMRCGVARRIDALFSGPLANAFVVVDMPIGLPDAGRRACEAMARKALGPRRSSVFPAPRRPMLGFADYVSANAWGKAQGDAAGGGLSKQAWNILPKIRELDSAILPEDQARIVEGHPEVAFARLGGAPCAHPKRSQEGAAERAAILKAHDVDPASLLTALRVDCPTKSIAADDDLIDACVLALTAEARLARAAWRLTDGARDARGLAIEIWG